MTEVLTATLATVSVGDISIYGYEVQGLEGYRHSLRQISATVGVNHETVGNILHSSPMAANSVTCNLKVAPEAGSSMAASNLNPRTILLTSEQVIYVYAQLTAKGNQKALALIVALATETLTRRLDAAFGKHRSDTEYQALTDAVYKSLRQKFQHEYLPKFHNYLECDWRNLQEIPAGIRGQSHWQAHQVYNLKRAVGLEHKTDVDSYSHAALVVYEQALLDYDCYRRTGFTHDQSLKALAKQDQSKQRRQQVLN